MVITILTMISDDMRPLRAPRCRWEDNIRMILGKQGRERCGLDASGPCYRPVAGFCENGNESPGSIKDREFLD
jgi:hypothetical protein